MAINTFLGKTFILESLKKAEELAKSVADTVENGDVLLLEGAVGAGKTTFTGFLVKALGSEELGQSPSYALHKTHRTQEGLINHFDLYRLENLASFESLDPWGVMEESFLTVVEWPFKVEVKWPENALLMKFELGQKLERKVAFLKGGA